MTCGPEGSAAGSHPLFRGLCEDAATVVEEEFEDEEESETELAPAEGVVQNTSGIRGEDGESGPGGGEQAESGNALGGLLGGEGEEEEDIGVTPNQSKLSRFKCVENTNYAVDLAKQNGMHMVGIQGADIVDGTKTLVLGLVWQLMR